MRLHLPNIVAIEQPLELLRSDRDRFILQMPRPGKTLLALDHFVPNNEVVFIKPLLAMCLIDQESPARSLLSRGGSDCIAVVRRTAKRFRSSDSVCSVSKDRRLPVVLRRSHHVRLHRARCYGSCRVAAPPSTDLSILAQPDASHRSTRFHDYGAATSPTFVTRSYLAQ